MSHQPSRCRSVGLLECRNAILHTALSAAVSASLLMFWPPASVSAAQLHHGNSTVLIEPESNLGIWLWEIDGREYLTQEWLWYRLGSAGEEQPINRLQQNGITSTDQHLDVEYTDGVFTLTTRFVLTGGDIASNLSRLDQFLTITNTSDSDLDFHLFKYADFDLNFQEFTDSIVMNGTLATQTGSNGAILSTTASVPASHFEASIRDNLLNALDDLAPTTLGDIGTQTDLDVEFAFQWDFVIPAGQSRSIQLVQNVAGVPEPAGLTLLGAMSVLILARRRGGPQR